jgi:coenzyme F420 hydrogenase subunit delta
MNGGTDQFLPSFCAKRALVLGCGNRLFGDDGFGPAVAEFLSDHYAIPDDVYVMDVGTGIRKLLFTLSLDPERPPRIIIVDAVDGGGKPGEIFEITPDDLPPEKKDEFSLHQVPSSNMVRELIQHGISVRVLACRAGRIPDAVSPGLSPPVAEAVPAMCRRIAAEVGLKPGAEAGGAGKIAEENNARTLARP